MKLHRAGTQADWTSVLPHNRSLWQRLAAATAGFVTPGNLITLLGLISVIFGLHELLSHHYLSGLLLLVVGRLLDLADGYVADATATKSQIGEAFDATVDKITVGLTAIVFAIVGVIGWVWLVILALPHLIISVAALYARARHLLIHPSKLGKVSMALLWVALLGFTLTMPLSTDTRYVLDLPFDLVALWSFILGVFAMLGYLRQVRRG